LKSIKHSTEEVFENRPAQIVGALVAGVFTFIGFAMVSKPDTRWTGLVFAFAGSFSLFRAMRSSSVAVDDTHVITRSMVRTRRFELAKLSGVEVAVGQTGWTGFGREYLVIHQSGEKTFSFRELNSKPSGGPTKTVVRRAAEAIEERLSALRS
jgi:hypothetical protein